MKIRWTESAAEDLRNITRFIRRDNPKAARQIAKNIFESCEGLAQAPWIGRKGKETDTRELVFSPLPYVAVYRVIGDAVFILHVWHGSQDR